MSNTPDASTPEPAATPAPVPSELCDLVMKGGITSGIIYPKLIAELADRYTFKNIGGTSAGAIAAGACAAAEYGRQHGNVTAFQTLGKLPDELSRRVEPAQRSRLFTLFQPSDRTRAHFEVLVGALNAKPAAAIGSVLTGLLEMQWRWAVAGLVVGALLLWPVVDGLAPDVGRGTEILLALLVLSIAALAPAALLRVPARRKWLRRACVAVAVALPLLAFEFFARTGWTPRLFALTLAGEVLSALILVALLAGLVARFGVTLMAGLHDNGYGFCSGQTPVAAPGPTALTDWLTGYFDALAGLPAGHSPLTFGDLWGQPDRNGPRAINLEVMTTAVSQTMGYAIPFRDNAPKLYYDPVEWSNYFPRAVMKWLDDADVACPDGDSPGSHKPGSRVVGERTQRPLRALPRRADLPVVVAIRMSLSFPVLLAAVPLYAIDWTRIANQQQQELFRKRLPDDTSAPITFEAKKIWFSDGGISSNMPLHLFDSLLPGHPTFAINLKGVHPDFPIHENPEVADNDGGRIFLADKNSSGLQRYWAAPDDHAPLGGLVGFLGGIFNTMQNWRDELQFPYPGFRDRIVQISQRPDEGGLNLDMPPNVLADLAGAGGMAAQRLVDRFHPQGAEHGDGWVNHQKIRLGTFLGSMQPASGQLHASLAAGTWARRAAEMGSKYTAAERQLMADFLARLEELAALSGASPDSLEKHAPKPLAHIGIFPRI